MARRAPSFVLVLAVVVGLATSTDLRADHAWGPYHWERVSDPVPLLLGDNVGPAWDDYLAEAIDDWDASPRLFLTLGEGAANPRNCRPGPGRIEVCSASYGNTGWLGVAQIWVDDGHITQANTRLNETYFSLPFYNVPSWRRFVMCQEIGHTFGLDHQDENSFNRNLGSCMDYTDDPAGPPSNVRPNAHDYNELEAIYAHAHATLRVPNALPPAMSNIDLAEPESWGEPIRWTAEGRPDTFMRDFGDKNRVLTHVFWTPDGP